MSLLPLPLPLPLALPAMDCQRWHVWRFTFRSRGMQSENAFSMFINMRGKRLSNHCCTMLRRCRRFTTCSGVKPSTLCGHGKLPS